MSSFDDQQTLGAGPLPSSQVAGFRALEHRFPAHRPGVRTSQEGVTAVSPAAPTPAAGDGYQESAIRMAACQRLKAVIEAAGSLYREKVRKAMWETTLPTVSGVISVDESGIGSMSPSPVEIHNGGMVPIYPFELAKKNHVYPTSGK